MMDFYLSQTAILNAKTSVDDFNQAVYGADAEIACRIDYKQKMVRSATGQEILISESTLYTDAIVKPDDKITFDGATWIVIGVKPLRMLDGSILFFEVNL
jgi:hypothetical protein